MRSNLRNKIMTILFLALLLAACSKTNDATPAPNPSVADNNSTAPIGSLAQIKQRGYLKISVYSDMPPFGYIDAEGKSQGYDIELAKALAKKLFGDETKVEYILTEPQHRIDVVKAKKADLTVANFTITPERAEQVDFTKPYFKTGIGVVSHKDTPIKSIDELVGQKLISAKGTTGEIFFSKKYPAIQQLKYDRNSEAFAALKDGRGIGLAHDDTILYAWVKNNPDYVVDLHGIGETDYIAAAVNKGDTELLNWLNASITELQQQEFFHRAYDKSIKPFYGASVNPDDVVIDASNLAN